MPRRPPMSLARLQSRGRTSGGRPPGKLTQLGGQVGTGAALAAPLRDGSLQRGQSAHHRIDIRLPPAAFAFLKPIHRAEVAPLSIAPPAGHHLVLRPGRSALDLGNEMVGGRPDRARARTSAPHAPHSVPLDGGEQPIAATRLVRRPGHPRADPQMRERHCGVLAVTGAPHRRGQEDLWARMIDVDYDHPVGHFAPHPWSTQWRRASATGSSNSPDVTGTLSAWSAGLDRPVRKPPGRV